MSQTHEHYDGHGTIKSGSERSFGIVFAAVFAIVGLFPLIGNWAAWGEIRWWSMGIAAVILAIAFLVPGLLRYPNRIWFQFGLLLNRIVNPVVMGILFWVVLTPVALVMRLKNSDPLRMRFDPGASSYWIPKDPDGPESEMGNQF